MTNKNEVPEPVAWWSQLPDNAGTDATTDKRRAEDWRQRGRDVRPLVFGDIAHPGAAAVRVTDAMVEAAWKELRVQCIPDGWSIVDCVDRDNLRSAITAAFTAASESTNGE